MNEILENIHNYKFVFGFLQNLFHEIPYFNSIKSKFNHSYILGSTGMGKSVLMERMAYYDIKKGIPVIFIDPKGNSVKRLYHLTKNKYNVRYVSFKSPIIINPLERKNYPLDTMIREFTQVLDVLITQTSINPESSVRMKEILNKAIKGLKPQDRNLLKLSEFLSLYEYRKSYVRNFMEDDNLVRWWTELDDTKKSGYEKKANYLNTMGSISSRLTQFIDNNEMRRIILGENELSIDHLLKEGQSLLINTFNPDMDNMLFYSNLFVYSIVSHIWSENKKLPLIVYIDEFQQCVSPYFSDILNFGRDALVGFVLAHHNFAEIDIKVLSSIFGNVGNFVCFRCGDKEAERLSNIFNIKSEDLFNLNKYYCWVKIDNKSSFISTYPPLITDIPEIIEQSNPVFYTDNSNITEQNSQFNLLSNDWIDL